jgi:hypothetical protein
MFSIHTTWWKLLIWSENIQQEKEKEKKKTEKGSIGGQEQGVKGESERKRE